MQLAIKFEDSSVSLYAEDKVGTTKVATEIIVFESDDQGPLNAFLGQYGLDKVEGQFQIDCTLNDFESALVVYFD